MMEGGAGWEPVSGPQRRQPEAAARWGWGGGVATALPVNMEGRGRGGLRTVKQGRRGLPETRPASGMREDTQQARLLERDTFTGASSEWSSVNLPK